MQHALFKCEVPQLELKRSRSFLAIKRCQRTKSKNVIRQSRSSLKSWVHICAHWGNAVKVPIRIIFWNNSFSWQDRNSPGKTGRSGSIMIPWCEYGADTFYGRDAIISVKKIQKSDTFKTQYFLPLSKCWRRGSQRLNNYEWPWNECPWGSLTVGIT
jgi:hypothetical protein